MKYEEMDEDIRDEVVKKYHDKIIAPDPFTSISNMIAWHEDMRRDDPASYAKMDTEAQNTMSLFSQFFFMPSNIAKAKTVYIDKDLIPSLVSTDNNVFFRNTGLPVMFINQDFECDNGMIKGMMIANAKELAEHMDNGMKMQLAVEGTTIAHFNTLLFLWVHLDFRDGTETWMSCTTHKDYKKYPEAWKQKLCKYVANIGCNIVDLMNYDVDNIDINVIETSKEENEKRIRKGKVPICKRVYIRPKQEVRNRYINFNRELRECGTIRHRFLVRGFWRHYRSSKWKEKKGTSTWVRPFIKGKGLFIEKEYKLEG